MKNKFAVFALTCAFMTAQVSYAETYRDEGRHFSFEVPEGWRMMTKEDVGAINDRAARLNMSQKIVYLGGLRPVEGEGFPFVLIQDQEGMTHGLTYENIEKNFGAEFQEGISKAKKPLENVGLKMSLKSGTLSIDRVKAVVCAMATVDAAQGGFQCLSSIHLGKDRALVLHAYEVPSKFEADAPLFQKFNDSFKFDAGYEFKPATSKPDAIIYVVALPVGAIVGAVAILLVARKKVKNTATRP